MFLSGLGPDRNNESRVTFFRFRRFGQVFGVNRLFGHRVNRFFCLGVINHRLRNPSSWVINEQFE